MNKIILFTLLLSIICTSTNIFATSDIQIITPTDTRFCSSASPQNAHLHPHDLPDDGSVYRVGNKRWNEEDEIKFAIWVKENVKRDFFVKYQIVTDCTDAALSIRAIFARIHHLPVAFVGGLHSHTEKKWSRLPTVKNWSEDNWKESLMKDTRFRKALQIWNSNVGTVNLHIDTYQIQVRNSDDTTRLSPNVRPGAILLDQGHTRFITEIDSLSWSPIKNLSSTVPAQVRNLNTGLFGIDYPSLTSTESKPDRGILNWNWVINCRGKFTHVPDKKMPYYSDEQMRFQSIYNSDDYNSLMSKLSRAKMLSNPSIGDFIKMQNMLIEMIHSRSEVVNLGYNEALRNPVEIQDLQGALYDLYSTPSRDAHLVEFYQTILRLIELFGAKAGYSNTDFAKKLLEEFINIDGEEKISIYHFILAFQYKQVSSHPFDSLELRWGLPYVESRRVEFNNKSSAISKELQAYLNDQNKIMNEIKLNKESINKYNKLSSLLSKTVILNFLTKYPKSWSLQHQSTINDLNSELTETKKKIAFIKLEKKALGL